MAVNKVVINQSGTEEVLVDLTGDTVNADSLVVGFTAHDKSGGTIAGANPYAKAATDATVNTQAGLLDQALAAIAGKAAGGSSGAFSASEEFIWTAPTEITASSSTVSIPHSLGVEPDGFMITCESLTYDSGDYVIASMSFDRGMYHAGADIYFALAPSFQNTYIGWAYAYYSDISKAMTSTNIKFKLYDISQENKIPAGKRYRVLVYKR